MENLTQFLPYSTMLLFAGLAVLIGYGFVNWLEAHNDKPLDRRFTQEENWPRWFYNLACIFLVLFIANLAILAGYWLSQIIRERTLTYLTTDVDWEKLSFYYLVGFGCFMAGFIVVVGWGYASLGRVDLPVTGSNLLDRLIKVMVTFWLADLLLWVIIAVMISFVNPALNEASSTNGYISGN